MQRFDKVIKKVYNPKVNFYKRRNKRIMSRTKKLVLTFVTILLINLMFVPFSFGSTGKITVDTVRVRKSPTTDSNILRNLDLGDEVEILSEEGDWYKIKYGNKEGFIYSEYVELEEKATNEDSKQTTNDEQGKIKTEIELEKNTKVYILPLLFSSTIENVQEKSTVEVIEKINNWVCVNYNNVKGWIFTKNLDIEIPDLQQRQQEEEKDEEQNNKIIKNGYVNVSSAYVRDSASKTGKIIDSLILNNQVEIIAEEDDWYKIKVKDGEGYIFAELISDKKTAEVTSRSSTKSRTSDTKTKTSNTSETSKETKSKEETTTITEKSYSDVVSYAKQFLGRKYSYGGSGPTSFDCSGFTQYVFKHFGVSLPHNAVKQAKYGSHVSKSELQPGDLVIFNNSANKSIGHAGIYIGSKKFIHAANPSRGVTTDSIDSSYYSKRFVEGRRIV